MNEPTRIVDELASYLRADGTAAGDPTVGWPQLLALADEHQLLPALWASLRAGGVRPLPTGLHADPRAPLAVLQHAYDDNATRVLDLHNQATSALDELGRKDIDALPLKGGHWLLAGWLPDPAARVMIDVDLLVGSEQAPDANAVLVRLGYEPLPEAESMGDHQLAPLAAPGRKGSLEVHVSPIVGFHRKLLTADEVRADAVTVDATAWARRVPSATHAMILAIGHPQLQDECARDLRLPLRALFDVATVAPAIGGSVDWDRVRFHFRRARASIALAGLRDRAGRAVRGRAPGTDNGWARVVARGPRRDRPSRGRAAVPRSGEPAALASARADATALRCRPRARPLAGAGRAPGARGEAAGRGPDSDLMSFPYHDPFWRDAGDFLAGAVAPNETVLAPDSFWWRFRRIERFVSDNLVVPPPYDWVVVHKGDLRALPRPFVDAVRATMRPVFANEVFVIWTAAAREPALGRDDPNVRSFLVPADTLPIRPVDQLKYEQDVVLGTAPAIQKYEDLTAAEFRCRVQRVLCDNGLPVPDRARSRLLRGDPSLAGHGGRPVGTGSSARDLLCGGAVRRPGVRSLPRAHRPRRTGGEARGSRRWLRPGFRRDVRRHRRARAVLSRPVVRRGRVRRLDRTRARCASACSASRRGCCVPTASCSSRSPTATA